MSHEHIFLQKICLECLTETFLVGKCLLETFSVEKCAHETFKTHFLSGPFDERHFLADRETFQTHFKRTPQRHSEYVTGHLKDSVQAAWRLESAVCA